MPVITLPSLIVITQHAYTFGNQGEAVFELMKATPDDNRDMSNQDLDEDPVAHKAAHPTDQRRLRHPSPHGH